MKEPLAQDLMSRLFVQEHAITVGEGIVVKMRYIPMNKIKDVLAIILKCLMIIIEQGDANPLYAKVKFDGEKIMDADNWDFMLKDIGEFIMVAIDDVMALINECCDVNVDDLPFDAAPIIIDNFIVMNFTGEKLKNWGALIDNHLTNIRNSIPALKGI